MTEPRRTQEVRSRGYESTPVYVLVEHLKRGGEELDSLQGALARDSATLRRPGRNAEEYSGPATWAGPSMRTAQPRDSVRGPALGVKRSPGAVLTTASQLRVELLVRPGALTVHARQKLTHADQQHLEIGRVVRGRHRGGQVQPLSRPLAQDLLEQRVLVSKVQVGLVVYRGLGRY
jgi:hypothetical protein